MHQENLKPNKTAVVFLNLGGPHNRDGVHNFLFRLFNDPFIIPYPKLVRLVLAKFIAYLRTPKAQKMYQLIHADGGSPLYYETCLQAQAFEQKTGHPTYVAMRYAPPFIEDVVKNVYTDNPDRIILLPLYPQYSMTTTQSALQKWFQSAASFSCIPTTWVPHFHDHPLFIKAHADLIRPIYEQAAQYGKPRIILSAHGLPVDLVAQGDPYPLQIEAGAAALSRILNETVHVCYQSRVGPKKWLEPSLHTTLKQAGKDKVPVVVVPFAFVSEHSETLYELDIEYKNIADQFNIPYYGRVPALGCTDLFMNTLDSLINNLNITD